MYILLGPVLSLQRHSYRRCRVPEESGDAATYLDDYGIGTVRFNKFPDGATRLEIPYIPEPTVLEDSTGSIPRVPRKYRDFLDYAASYLLALDKNDNRAPEYFRLAQARLASMAANERKDINQTDRNFGRLFARREQMTKYKNQAMFRVVGDQY